MTEADQVELDVMFDVRPDEHSLSSSVNVSLNLKVEEFVVATVVLKMTPSSAVGKVVHELKVYDRTQKKFLDQGRTLAEQGVVGGNFLIITIERDKETLNRMTVREPSTPGKVVGQSNKLLTMPWLREQWEALLDPDHRGRLYGALGILGAVLLFFWSVLSGFAQ